MTEKDPASAEADVNADEKYADPRTPRSIRFSDSEWARVEQAANERGMTAAELVRHAAMSLADGKDSKQAASLTPGLAGLIERTFRNTYILATLKRDELIHEGRGDDIDELVRTARKLQASVLNGDTE